MNSVLNNPMVIAVICIGVMCIGPGMIILFLNLRHQRYDERIAEQQADDFWEWERQIADREIGR